MPMYLVRWDNGETELVAANNDLDLAWGVLDQVGNPYDAVWQQIPKNAPIWLGIAVDVEYHGEIREVVPNNVEPCDDRGGMSDWILQMAFPEVWAVKNKYAVNAGEASKDEIEQALARDLATFPPPGRGWQRAQPRPDDAGVSL